MENGSPHVDPSDELEEIRSIRSSFDDLVNDLVEDRNGSGDSTDEQRLSSEKGVYTGRQELSLASCVIIKVHLLNGTHGSKQNFLNTILTSRFYEIESECYPWQDIGEEDELKYQLIMTFISTCANVPR
jgi:hypothetical protein